MLNWQELIYKAPLGHKARNKRAAHLQQDLLQGHTANSHGIAGASPLVDQTANQGAWRFLDSKHLNLQSLYQPVHAALLQKIPVGQRAYILHDVSVVDYSRHDRKEDLCVVGDGRGYGYELFSSLVLDGEGKPLGCLGSELRTILGLWRQLVENRATERVRKDLAADSVHPSVNALIEHLLQQIAEFPSRITRILRSVCIPRSRKSHSSSRQETAFSEAPSRIPKTCLCPCSSIPTATRRTCSAT